jgi:poly-gamma-glutamate capsule biosynthesis protein CapA/YwtB (metallophosphatase superfamily)
VVCREPLVAVTLIVVVGLAACTDQTDGNRGGYTSAATASTVSGHGGPFSVTIAASGDVLAHAAVTRDAQKNAGGSGYDFRPMFADVTPLVSAADLALCHMETPISRADTHLTVGGQLVFNTPHEMLDGVKSAGYDGCDFASNHAWDQGLDGLKSTTAAFADARLGYAGPNPDPRQPQAVASYEVHGVTVAHLAYTYTMLNRGDPSTETPPGALWLGVAMWPIQQAAGIIAAAHRARQADADVVVVSLHWGQEYIWTPTKEQTALAEALLASPDIDLILGTHVHVVQPCQTLQDKLVFYGLGNSLSNQSSQVDSNLKPQTQDGMIATVTVSRDASGKVTDSATYQPTSVDLNGHVIRLATRTGNPTTWNRTVATVGAMGGCSAKPAQ